MAGRGPCALVDMGEAQPRFRLGSALEDGLEEGGEEPGLRKVELDSC